MMTLFCTACRELGSVVGNKTLSWRGAQVYFLSRMSPRREFARLTGHQLALKSAKTMSENRFSVLTTNTNMLGSKAGGFHSFSVVNTKFDDKLNLNEELHVGDNVRGSGTSDLGDDDLTAEERQILKVLEEEERRYRENASSSDDYHIWDDSDKGSDETTRLTGSVAEGYVPFQNQQRIIQDVIDEIWNPLPQQEEEEEPEPRPYYPRGKTGVFDLGELVDLLRDEYAKEVVAITLPKELDYADYMVIVTVGNNRQLLALANFVRKRFKMKDRKPTDKLPFFDKSIKHQGWIALDLGNIILHIFLQKVRDYYDLELLWTVGPLFDDLYNAKDSEIIQLLNSIT